MAAYSGALSFTDTVRLTVRLARCEADSFAIEYQDGSHGPSCAHRGNRCTAGSGPDQGWISAAGGYSLDTFDRPVHRERVTRTLNGRGLRRI